MANFMLTIKIAFIVIAILYPSASEAQMLVSANTVKAPVSFTSPSTTIHTIEVPNIARIQHHFNKNFYGVPEVNWHIIDDGIIAKFNKGAIPYRVSYSHSGLWKHTIKYLDKCDIPEEIQDLIQARFDNFSVLRAREIQVPNSAQHIYLVQIQKHNQFKEISVQNKRIRTLNSFYTF